MKAKHGAFSLKDIKAACSNPKKLPITTTAQTSAMSLGLNNEGIVSVIQNMRARDYDQTHMADHDPDQMMDVYKPAHENDRLYVKFTETGEGIYVISFKRN